MSLALLRRPWDLIGVARPARAGEFRVAESTVRCGTEAILFALDEEGNRHLLVPLNETATVTPDRRSAGVHLCSFVLEEDGAKRAFIDIACRKPHLNEVFALLAAEMLDELARDCRDPTRVCRAVLLRWRELLDREYGHRLSLEALVGLYCELLVLRDLARRDARAVTAWTGPLGTPFDFTSRSLAIEAKGVVGAGWEVVIHGLDQLDAPAGTDLVLSVHQLQQTETGGESVPDIVEKLMAAGVDKPVLLARLARVGYTMDDREYYVDTRFRPAASRVWAVDSTFPRLTRASFGPAGPPRAVKALTYVLDLSRADKAPLQPEEAAALYDHFAAAF
jgi:hypothetical protein